MAIGKTRFVLRVNGDNGNGYAVEVESLRFAWITDGYRLNRYPKTGKIHAEEALNSFLVSVSITGKVIDHLDCLY
ncbi:unnamed protein product [Lasius platythorax]|uniref:Phage protein n=1 Tax=Lasius platythorax TaxID=488582 RepID=A0AAV2N274_9HYME